MDYTLPVAKRTRSRVAQMFRKIHEEMKKKNGKAGSSNATGSTSFNGFREVNKGKSSSGSCQYGAEKEVSGSTSFGGCRKGNESRNLRCDDDSVDEIDFVDDSDNEEEEIDLGSSNFESYGVESFKSDDDDDDDRQGCKKSRRMEVEESCSGWKDQEKDIDDEILVISDSDSGDIESIRSEEESKEDSDGSNDEDYGDESSDSSFDFLESSSEGEEEEEDKDESDVSGLRGKREVVGFNNKRTSGKGGFCKEQATKKRICAYDDDEVVKILGNSMFGEEEMLCEKFDEPVIEPILPQKCIFGMEESVPVEKSEEEKELENLWAEMALALYSDDATEGPSEADVSPELDEAALCHQGNHQFILDEEIGIKCKLCSFVDLEIKYYTAPFGRNPWGNAERRDRYDEKLDIFDELCDQDCSHDSKHGYDPCTYRQGTVWSIIPGIGKDLHEHQREGFEFLWENIAGGIYIDKLKEPTRYDGGSGCIISHAPGTGKTRLAIVFLQSYMKLYPSCRPVIIAPCSMLLSWEAEFQKWKVDIPFHNLNMQKFCGKENAFAMRLIKSGQHSIDSIRMVKLYSWKKDTSVLAISYKLFEKLVGEDEKKRSKGQHKSEDDVRKALLELPGLLVLDEGHTPRNDSSLIFKALSRIRTDKRIILSGTPFQNNFDELFNTLLLVRPKFADELCNQFVARKKYGRKKKGARENWASLTSAIGKDGNDRLKAEKLVEVRAMIKPFVHVHRGNILQQRLPGLRDAVVILQPVHLQKRLLDKVQAAGHPQTFHLEHLLSVVSVHPSLICKEAISEEFAEHGLLKKHRLNPDMGVKTKFLIELILLSNIMNERVLVFSQYRDPLKLIVKQLESRFCWTEGKEILHMHGAVDAYHRQSMIKHFNDRHSEARVLLASTKACSEGINLVGASRVVLLDVVWNPSVERQAVSRAYRLGQEKIVYIYHLITSGTMEEDKYCRQAEKERLSELVFYSSDRAHGSQKISSNISDDKKDKLLEGIVERNKLKDILKRIIYQPKDTIVDDSFGLQNL